MLNLFGKKVRGEKLNVGEHASAMRMMDRLDALFKDIELMSTVVRNVDAMETIMKSEDSKELREIEETIGKKNFPSLKTALLLVVLEDSGVIEIKTKK